MKPFRTLVMLALLALSSHASASEVTTVVPSAPTESVTTIIPHPDNKLSWTVIIDGSVEFTQADFEGTYTFRETAEGAPITLTTEAFADYMRRKQFERTILDRHFTAGWIVEYSAEDGHVFLWSPDKEAVMPGKWDVRTTAVTVQNHSFSVVQLCFIYPGHTNPFVGQSGDEWDCWPAATEVAYPEMKARQGREFRPGDPFNLKSGNVPYIRTKETRPDWPDEVNN